MPLSAIVNGQLTLAPSLSATEWHSLHATKPLVTLPCCGGAAFMRTSRGGLQHFYHAVASRHCSVGLESVRHLELKAQLVRAILAAGWNAETEVSDPKYGWRADVLASRGTVRVAFEVQLARIDLQELRRRQDRYAEAKVRGAWFLGAQSLKQAQLPCASFDDTRRQEFFRITHQPFFDLDDQDKVTIGGLRLDISTTVEKLLGRCFKHVPRQKIVRITSARIYRVSVCYACRRDFDVYFIFESDTPLCLQEPPIGFPIDSDTHAKAASAQVKKAVKSFVSREPEGKYCLSFPDWQGSAAGRRYRSFRCFHCNAPMSADLWPSLLDYGVYIHDNSLTMRPFAECELFRNVVRENDPHWCHSTARSFCD